MSAHILPFFTRPSRSTARGPAERAFLPAALEIVETPASPTMRISAALISAFLVGALVWSYLGHVDIVATAPGKVIARHRTKIIQPAETGEVRAIEVAEGDHVEKDQVLIVLDPTISKADQARYSDERLQAELDRARLRAELAPPTDDPFAGTAAPADMMAAARARLKAEMTAVATKLAKVDEDSAAKRAELAQIDAEIAKIDAEAPLIAARANIRAEGLKSGYGNKLDLLTQQQALVGAQNERIVNEKKREEVQAALAALTVERAKTEAEFKNTVYADLAKANREVAEAVAGLAKANRTTDLKTLAAPVAGIVQDLTVHTLGGVVTPAQQLLRIVPTDGGIEVDAVIANQDVGFVQVGQPVEIKVDTFPFTRYGLVHGRVREISKDAVEDPQINQRFQGTLAAGDAPNSLERSRLLVYTARATLEESEMNIDGKSVKLEPGMAVTAEIKTGRRRVIDFLLSPFHRYSHDALRER